MIIIDTSYIIAFFSEKDFHHKKAVEFISQLDEDLFAPIEVIQELMTTLSRKVSSLYAVKVASSILENNSINIINSHELVFDKAFDTFKKLNPHKFSFVDCVLISLAKNSDATILTFDKDLLKAVSQH